MQFSTCLYICFSNFKLFSNLPLRRQQVTLALSRNERRHNNEVDSPWNTVGLRSDLDHASGERTFGEVVDAVVRGVHLLQDNNSLDYFESIDIFCILKCRPYLVTFKFK